MKKFIARIFESIFIVLGVIGIILCCGCESCKSQNKLSPYVTELRQDVYIGENENYKLKGTYGYKTENEKKLYNLKITMTNVVNYDATYTCNFSYEDKNFSDKFSLNQAHDCFYVSYQIDNFNLKDFSVEIVKGELKETVQLKSVIQEDIISVDEALSSLCKNQPTLIESYYENNVFIGKITMRVLENNGKNYYYVGLSKNEKTVALLIDGKTGEILAIRNVF